jgi:hypothetical protein
MRPVPCGDADYGAAAVGSMIRSGPNRRLWALVPGLSDLFDRANNTTSPKIFIEVYMMPRLVTTT